MNKILLFIVNVGNEEVNAIKDCPLAYLTLGQYDNLSEARENDQESVIPNILTAVSETNVEILPAISSSSEMIFPGDLTPLRKCYFKIQKYL